MKKTISILLVTILVGISFPSLASAEKVSLSGAILVNDHNLVKNCTPITTKADKDNNVEIDKSLAALPIVYILTAAPDQTTIEYLGSFLSPVINDHKQFYSCNQIDFTEIQISASSLSTVPRLILSATNNILWVITWCIKLVLQFLGGILITMIAQGQYITNPIVATAWPFIQGIANLGFIIALLYIAFATTLRLESVATSVQRLLPKLLIAALLVNFSLVIGGLLIDASRVVMAVEINLMGNGTVTGENFTDKLVASTEAITATVAGLKNQGTNNSFLAIMVKLFQNVFFIFVLTLGIGVIAINLLVRYIALIILLMISPLAYLALALPKTAGYASMWWSNFIKWVAYGPIVLFFLLIIIRVQNIAPTLPEQPDPAGANSWIPFFNATLHFIIVIALFFVANTMGKKVAGIGSDMAMGFANKTGAWARKNPKKAVGIGVGVMTGGVGAGVLAAGGAGLAQMGYTGARQQAGDFLGSAKDNLKGNSAVKKVRDALGYDLRDKEGNLLKGKSTMGSGFGQSLTGGLNTKVNKEIADIKALGTITDPNEFKKNPLLLPSEIAKGHIPEALGDTNVKFLIENGSQAHRNALASNPDYIAGLKPADMKKLQQTILSAPHTEANKKTGIKESGVSDRDKTETMEKIAKTVADLKK